MKSIYFPLLTVLFSILLTAGSYALTPEEAKANIGKDGTVTGTASQVSLINGNIFINVGGKYPNNPFSAFVGASDVTTIGADFLKGLEGKQISVTGKIIEHKGKPEIKVNKKEQILEATPAPTTGTPAPPAPAPTPPPAPKKP